MPIPARLVPCVLLALAAAASPQDGEGASAAGRPAIERDARGLFVRLPGQERFGFVRWRGEQTFNRVLAGLKGSAGAEISFAPGTYVIEQGLVVEDVADLVISGSPGVILEFADGPETAPRTVAPIAKGDRSIRVDSTDGLRAGWRYQLYAPDGTGDRVLEFTVRSVEDGEVALARPAHFMPHVTEIPPNCRMYEEVNVFRVLRCPGLVVQNLVMDGKGRGEIRGHTIYTGLYIIGDYREGERPTTKGLTVRGCTFRGFQGRGIAFYATYDARIEGNAFYSIRAQAIEIDHFSSGHVLNNFVVGAEVGVMVNDAFESLVEGNVLRDCEDGVVIMRVLPGDWVNTDNTVRDNVIGPGCHRGVRFFDKLGGEGIRGNLVQRNLFLELPRLQRVVNAEGNTVEER